MQNKIEIIDRSSLQDGHFIYIPKKICFLDLSFQELALYLFLKTNARTNPDDEYLDFDEILKMLQIKESEFFEYLEILEMTKFEKGKTLIKVKETEDLMTITIANAEVEMGGSDE